MKIEGGTCPTPLGDFSFVEVDGAVSAAGFGPLEEIRRMLPEQIRGARVEPSASDVAARIEKYFDGDVRTLDDIEVRQEGSDFRKKVWDGLRSLPAGSPVSYGEMAELVGHPRAARAVGTACATNAVALIVPCHRVTRGGGVSGRYGYGSDLKTWLLAHERTHGE